MRAPHPVHGPASADAASSGRAEMARAFRAWGAGCATVAFVIGALSMIGWATGNELLRGVFAGGITIKTNAALSLALTGASLFLLTPAAIGSGRRLAALALASAAIVIAVATLSEHATGWDLGIDQLLFHEAAGAVATTSPNRMGPLASLCFTLIGAALWMLDGGPGRRGALSQRLAVFVLLASGLPIIGYVFKVREMFGIARFTGIALQTAVSLFVLAAGMLLARPENAGMRRLSAPDSGGMLVRRMLPAAIVLPVLLAWVRTVGQDLGFYDLEFGRALLVLSFMLVFTSLVWWTGAAVSRHAALADALRDRLNATYRTLAEATPALVWTADRERRATFVNPRWRDYTGATLESLQDAGWAQFYHPDDAATLEGTWAGAGRRRTPFELEFRFRRHDGAYRWFIGRTVPVAEGDDGVDQWIGVLFDIHEQKLAATALGEHAESLEARVNERTDELQRTHLQMVQFSYSVAHDLRAPIRAIRGYLDVLLEEIDAPEQAIEHGRRIREATTRMDALIVDLLAYSRMSQIDLVVEAVDLRSAVAEAMGMLQDEIYARDALIDLPDGASAPLVRAHRATLVQVILNLIGNALKFVDVGVRPRIRIGWSEAAGRVRAEVIDNGIGIARDHHERIFTIFEQLHTRDRFPGTGVGLAMVQKAIERLDGTVGVESAPGHGSTFWFELPLASAGPPPALTGPESTVDELRRS